jgi:ABC-type uncharacterized transport system auxiliary subunit
MPGPGVRTDSVAMPRLGGHGDSGALPRRRAGASALFSGLAALACSALPGCSGLFHNDSPATQVYVLRAAAQPQPDPSGGPQTLRSNGSLHVARPIAGPGLGSDHILLVESGHRMSYYMASRWPADLPSVVEGLAVDALRASGTRPVRDHPRFT